MVGRYVRTVVALNLTAIRHFFSSRWPFSVVVDGATHNKERRLDIPISFGLQDEVSICRFRNERMDSLVLPTTTREDRYHGEPYVRFKWAFRLFSALSTHWGHACNMQCNRTPRYRSPVRVGSYYGRIITHTGTLTKVTMTPD